MRRRRAHALSWCFRTKRGERTTHRIRQIVGREITLSGQPFTVVGVTKPGQLLPGDDIVAFWVPLTMANAFQVTNPWQERADPSLAVIGRVQTGVTQAQLRAWFDTWLRQRFPSGTEGAPLRVGVGSLATRIPLNRGTTILFSVLVSAFAPGAARRLRQRDEHDARARIEPAARARRAAVAGRDARARRTAAGHREPRPGASGRRDRPRAHADDRARVPSAAARTLPEGTHVSSLYIAPLDPDARVLALLAIAAVAGAILVGLSPALQVARANLVLATRGELGPETRISRVRTALVGAQIAAAVLCLIGANGLAGEVTRMASADTGLDFGRVVNVMRAGRSTRGDRTASRRASCDRARGGRNAPAAHRRASDNPPRPLAIWSAQVEETVGFMAGLARVLSTAAEST